MQNKKPLEQWGYGRALPMAEHCVCTPHCWPLTASLLPAASDVCSRLTAIHGCAPTPGAALLPSSCCSLQRATDELRGSDTAHCHRGAGSPWFIGCRHWVWCLCNASRGFCRAAPGLRSLPAALWPPLHVGITAGFLGLIIGCHDSFQD